MENEKPILRGELALIAAIVINSFSVVLILYSGSGISAISSVPYAFSEVFTMGKMVAIIGNWIDQRVTFVSVLSKQQI